MAFMAFSLEGKGYEVGRILFFSADKKNPHNASTLSQLE
jgi:hypothetical protein